MLGLEPEPEVPKGLGPVVVQCEKYSSLMDVMDSDHKPVFVVLKVEFNTWDTVRDWTCETTCCMVDWSHP